MFYSFILVFTPLFRYLILKKSSNKIQKISIVVIFGGLAVVCSSMFLYDNEKHTTSALAVFLSVIANFVYALHYTICEYVFPELEVTIF